MTSKKETNGERETETVKTLGSKKELPGRETMTREKESSLR